jgi:hypothetical protein
MENSYLKRTAVIDRISAHPLGAFAGGAITALVCGFFGAVHGTEVMIVMGVLGTTIGAPLGAMLAASNSDE